MKRITMIVWLFAALGSATVEAQSVLKANIPFDFQLGKTTMPAGQYRVEMSANHILLLQCPAQKKAARIVTVPATRPTAAKTGILEFNRYGDTYFFAGSWMPDSTEGEGVVKSPPEKELARRLATGQPTSIALATGR